MKYKYASGANNNTAITAKKNSEPAASATALFLFFDINAFLLRYHHFDETKE